MHFNWPAHSNMQFNFITKKYERRAASLVLFLRAFKLKRKVLAKFAYNNCLASLSDLFGSTRLGFRILFVPETYFSLRGK